MEFQFEKALEELKQKAQKLENGDLSLDDSIKEFEQGMALSKKCQEHLNDAQKKVEILLSAGKDGIETKAFE